MRITKEMIVRKAEYLSELTGRKFEVEMWSPGDRQGTRYRVTVNGGFGGTAGLPSSANNAEVFRWLCGACDALYYAAKGWPGDK